MVVAVVVGRCGGRQRSWSSLAEIRMVIGDSVYDGEGGPTSRGYE